MSIYKFSDPIRDAQRFYSDLEDELERRPKCSCCGEHIQTETAIEMDGQLYCEDCEFDNVRDLWSRIRDDYMVEVE